MEILKLIIISVVLVIIAFGAMSVRLLFVKDGKFSGGSCKSSAGLEERGIACACGSKDPCSSNDDGY
ncbi:MAG: hypothetical protein R6U58_07325 [Bacteroidales bacterium]